MPTHGVPLSIRSFVGYDFGGGTLEIAPLHWELSLSELVRGDSSASLPSDLCTTARALIARAGNSLVETMRQSNAKQGAHTPQPACQP